MIFSRSLVCKFLADHSKKEENSLRQLAFLKVLFWHRKEEATTPVCVDTIYVLLVIIRIYILYKERLSSLSSDYLDINLIFEVSCSYIAGKSITEILTLVICKITLKLILSPILNEIEICNNKSVSLS